MESQSKEDAK